MIRKNKSLIFSLIVAAIMNLIHINIFNTDLTPDFILLALIFWFFKNPNAVSISLFWFVGLVTDIFIGDLLGQYALTYASCYFIAQYSINKIMLNNKYQQLFYIFFIFLSAQIIMLMINVMHDLQYPGLSYFIQSIIAALIWYLLTQSKFFKLER
ncbi:rod shape-determining protein MreD [Candidatus Methylopumilus rimovensis]|uniref:Rod shape-determining protein MreD n=1 Tax=Candidatus Methylopumilus rimovensis TaxID=2588535 RepID=A0AAE6FRV3_9PROT|nr:rod shape-determining protein MreD [Candidatus Methylopumilus rimovensis]QDD13010.1 rod shape-determining protein MreD [Candidatus Methylopumilus rimovensis]